MKSILYKTIQASERTPAESTRCFVIVRDKETGQTYNKRSTFWHTGWVADDWHPEKQEVIQWLEPIDGEHEKRELDKALSLLKECRDAFVMFGLIDQSGLSGSMVTDTEKMLKKYNFKL